jgi:hypothetical protein
MCFAKLTYLMAYLADKDKSRSGFITEAKKSDKMVETLTGTFGYWGEVLKLLGKKGFTETIKDAIVS